MHRWLIAILLFVWSAPAAGQTRPERPPECTAMTGLGEGFADAFLELGVTMYAIFARVVPDAGFHYDLTTGLGWAQISWPLDVAFAPETARKEFPRKCREDVVFKAYGSRLLLEPMIRVGAPAGELTARFHLRPGYRFLYRSAESKVGFGAGLGSTLDFAGGLEASVSPEAVVSFGECCVPSYFTVAARYDRYVASARDTASIQIGWTFH